MNSMVATEPVEKPAPPPPGAAPGGGEKKPEGGKAGEKKTASAGATAHCVVAVSQPPVKPARSRPLRTYAFLRITLQMRPLR